MPTFRGRPCRLWVRTTKLLRRHPTKKKEAVRRVTVTSLDARVWEQTQAPPLRQPKGCCRAPSSSPSIRHRCRRPCRGPCRTVTHGLASVATKGGELL